MKDNIHTITELQLIQEYLNTSVNRSWRYVKYASGIIVILLSIIHGSTTSFLLVLGLELALIIGIWVACVSTMLGTLDFKARMSFIPLIVLNDKYIFASEIDEYIDLLIKSGPANTREQLAELGLKPDATTDEIKKAYRKKALLSHPDKGGEEEDFKKLNNLYEDLLNARLDLSEDEKSLYKITIKNYFMPYLNQKENIYCEGQFKVLKFLFWKNVGTSSFDRPNKALINALLGLSKDILICNKRTFFIKVIDCGKLGLHVMKEAGGASLLINLLLAPLIYSEPFKMRDKSTNKVAIAGGVVAGAMINALMATLNVLIPIPVLHSHTVLNALFKVGALYGLDLMTREATGCFYRRTEIFIRNAMGTVKKMDTKSLN